MQPPNDMSVYTLGLAPSWSCVLCCLCVVVCLHKLLLFFLIFAPHRHADWKWEMQIRIRQQWNRRKSK